MNRCFSFLALILITLSCSTSSNSVESKKAESFKTYLALGDSYTIGESVKQEESFPFVIVDYLNRQSLSFQTPTVIAKTGWRTDELLEQTLKLSPNKKFDLVSLLIGVNNQYQNKDIAQFKEEFPELLRQAIKRSKNGERSVFVFSIPDYSIVPFAKDRNPNKIASQIANYNALCESFCKQYNVAFYDITPISKTAKNNSSLIAEDQLHPSGKMYQLWVKQYIESIIKHHIL